MKGTWTLAVIIRTFTPRLIVLDPFFGAGTTGLVCEKLGRGWVGLELNEEYCEIAAKRIEMEAAQGKLFA